MTDSKDKKQPEQQPAAVYFKSLTIRDVKCFRDEHTIDLSDGEGRPAQWTVILGNNNTGKTTVLKCLAGLEAARFKAGNVVSCSPIEIERWHDDEWTLGAEEVGSKMFLSFNSSIKGKKADFHEYNEVWSYGTGEAQGGLDTFLENFLIEAYGASRKTMKSSISNISTIQRHSSLYLNSDLYNVEEWLLQAHLARFQGNDKKIKEKALKVIQKVTEILTSGMLPDVTQIQFSSEKKGQSFDNFIEFQTDFGWIRLRDLGYGYQTMLAWILDLVRRMFERYPESPNPIREPAIVLVDEIDLHLHPEWQRKIIAHLAQYFPNTQFIVTAHSPLVVQSAEKINLVLLEKEGDHVNISQPKIQTYKGWTLEEILTELMGLDERIHSDAYLELIGKFDKALDEDNFEAARAAYDELDKILHPQSNQRKLLRLQMSSLTPA